MEKLKEFLPMLGVLGAICSFLWGVFVWDQAQKEKQTSAVVEAAKPFLSIQLKFYAEAVGVTAKIATLGGDDPDRQKNIQRFWELYWGELAFVESKEVESAMIDFGKTLNGSPNDTGTLKQLSLRVADACRKSTAQSWNARAWVNPDQSEGYKQIPRSPNEPPAKVAFGPI